MIRAEERYVPFLALDKTDASQFLYIIIQRHEPIRVKFH
jgi:hypothetical protein